jgi:hypothetical protein
MMLLSIEQCRIKTRYKAFTYYSRALSGTFYF